MTINRKPAIPRNVEGRIRSLLARGEIRRADRLALRWGRAIGEEVQGTNGACSDMKGVRVGWKHLSTRSYRLRDGTHPCWGRALEA